jgi:A/G-specific adenine glycosylase
MMLNVSGVFGRTLASCLEKWWKTNGRSFHWRETKDPYRVLISEVLLHRTSAKQVVPVYERLVRQYPNITALAQAPYSDIYSILKPLGLNWRSSLLYKMARTIVNYFDGEIPRDREILKSLPGVSDYIASAFRCFAYDDPEVLLDTNTVRVLGRIFERKISDSSRRSREFTQLYERILDKGNPRDFNYAMIDLGALVCVTDVPKCEICPLNRYCGYGRRMVKCEKSSLRN